MPVRTMLSGLLISVIGILACIGFFLPDWTVRAGSDLPPLLYTSAPVYDALAWMSGAERFPSGATLMLRDANGQRALVPEFAASADAAVSFDGQRVLFAGRRKADDPWQIWELELSQVGGEPRALTSGSEACVRPMYLPDDRMVYARKIAGRFAIVTANLRGGKPQQLTYGPASLLPTDVLKDGRILVEAGFPLGAAASPEIYTLYPDGSGIESYRCDHGKSRMEGRQMGSGDIVFALRSGLARFTSAKAREVPIVAPAGEYGGDLAETESGDWLLPWRKKSTALFELVLWTRGAEAFRPVVANESANTVQPALLAEHRVPKRFPSGLHDWANANLLCLNAYTSKSRLAKNAIHYVRLYTRDRNGQAQLLGTAPVERDGSFFVHVPSEEPLQIELLDAAGHILKREEGFFWMRRGEQRACVGCHAGPETAPENAVPMILMRSTTPADMTGKSKHEAEGGQL